MVGMRMAVVTLANACGLGIRGFVDHYLQTLQIPQGRNSNLWAPEAHRVTQLLGSRAGIQKQTELQGWADVSYARFFLP